MLAKDVSDYAEMTNRTAPLLALARRTDAAVLLVHHASKGERQGVDAILGSTAIAAAVDNVFLLERGLRDRVSRTD